MGNNSIILLMHIGKMSHNHYSWKAGAAVFAASFLSAIPVSCVAEKVAESIWTPPETALERRVEQPAMPIPNANDFSGVSDDVLLGMLVFGEVRNAPAYIQEMVAHTAYNRSGKNKWWGRTLRDVILKPEQYKCFGDHNREKMLHPTQHEPLAVWARCYGSAQRAGRQEQQGVDLTGDATHFYTTQVVDGKETFAEPRWAKGRNTTAAEQWRGNRRKLFRIKFYHLER